MKRFVASKSLVMIVLALGLALSSACAGRRVSGMGFASVGIAAPPEKVFSYLANLENEHEWNPALRESTDFQGRGLGMTFRWKTEMLGRTYEGKSMVVEYIPNQRLAIMDISDQADMKLTWIVVPDELGAKLFCTLEMSGQLPPGIPYAAMRKLATETIDEDLKLIKAAVEKK